MSGRARLALCAWVATLLTSCSLLPLVDDLSWLLQVVILLGIQTIVGAGARRVPLAWPLTVAAQLLVTLVLLTLVFAREQAFFGLVPGPDAFQQFGTLLRTGTDDVGRYAIPAPLSDGIRLMLVGGALLIGLAVDTLAVTFRSAAPAGLPLLALYSVAAGLSDGSGGGVWFLLAAAGYLMLLLAEGRDRLSQWGRVFGGGPRAPGEQSAGGAIAPLRTGWLVGSVALVVALFAPLALPSLDGGLLSAAGSGAGSGSGGGGTISAVNPLVSLRDSLNVDEDRQVMSVRNSSEDTQDLYLRIVALDTFDGTAWKPSQRSIEDVPKTFPNPLGLGADVRRTEITTTIAAADWYAQDWLPMPYPATGVKIDGSWRFEPVGRTLVGDHGQNTRGARYTVTSLDVQPTAQQLAEAPKPDPALVREFTQVPESLPAIVARTAREVTAGSANDYERADKLQDYFAVSGGFRYDTDVEVGSGSNAIARFLRDKEGFCVHFSFAMASMARTLGIPARVAVGFAPGTPQPDGTVSVGLRDAHAWPELYFEGVGWTRFEPTPDRGSEPEYTRSLVPGGDIPDPDLPSQNASVAPSDSASASETCTTTQQRPDGECASGSTQTALGQDDDSGWLLEYLKWALVGLGVLTLLLLPMLWRRRVRGVRIGGHGRTGADATAHTLSAWHELADSAWDFGISPEESQTPRQAAARIVRLGRLDPSTADAVHRVADAVEQILYAPSPRPVAGLAEDVRRVTEALRTTVSRGTKLRAAFVPRSTVRVLWALSARWAALGRRASAARPTLRKPWGQQS
jgi:transglutaminase-like putative cysteine protease